EELARRFFAAAEQGDVEALEQLLADDVVVYGDGGGKSPSWPRPIVGRERVSRLFGALGPQMRVLGARVRLHEVNGQPGAVVHDRNGRIINVFSLDIAD